MSRLCSVSAPSFQEDTRVSHDRRPPGRLLAALLLSVPGLAAPGRAEEAPPPPVASLQVRGNALLPAETLLYYVSTRAGDAYDPTRLRRDFRRLWDTGFLDDLAIDVQDAPRGKAVVFVVKERPRIRIVDFRGSKALSRGAIDERLKEESASLPIDGFYDLSQARRIESVLKRALERQGFPFAQVRHEARALAGAGVQVSFVIDDGLKARVKTIDFTGNAAFDDAALRRRVKLRQRRFWNLSWLTGGTTFTAEAWRQDQKRLEDFLLDRGHVTSSVGQPVLSYEDGRAGLFKRRPVKWLRLEIPVFEGPAYRVGDLCFEGLKVFQEADVRPLFELAPGDVYRDSRMRKGIEKLQDAYGRFGYYQATAGVQRQPDHERRVVDVVLRVDEDRQYRVGRIAFEGNDTTRDKVLRREVHLSEGDVFNVARVKDTVRRLNQLGYFKTVDVPEIKPSAAAEDAMDLTFKVQEQSQTQVTMSVGTGGAVRGATYSLGLGTNNFMGRGQNAQLSAQRGGGFSNYQLAFSEPSLFDSRVGGGFDVSKLSRQVPESSAQGRDGYTRREALGRLSAGLPLGRFTRLLADYSYGIIDVIPEPGADPALFPSPHRRESRIAPSVVYSTVDHFFTPRRGVRLSGGLQLVGGPLGGTVHAFEPNLKAVGYIPHTRRTALGLRFEGGWLLPFGETARVDPLTGHNGLEVDQRYRLGGETQVRGFEPLTIGPRDAQGRLIGGNKFVLGSAEYYLDVGRSFPVRAVAFFDAGQAYAEGQNVNLGALRTSTGVELRFLIPMLNVPVRLVKAWNLHRDPGHEASTGVMIKFGTSF